MKLLLGICLLLTLPLTNPLFAQEDYLFTSMEEALSVPPEQVYRLDLSKAKFKEFPAKLFSFTNLKWLNLSRNKLKVLPNDFYFKNLEYLNLSKNEFVHFPEQICEIRSLKSLYLQKNNIASIPKCIGQLTKLERIDLWFNLVDSFPDEFVNCRALIFADFRGVSYAKNFQEEWRKKMPWVNFEFDLGCDCGK